VTISLPLVVATLWGCGGGEPADLSKTPDGRLCQRAYSSTIDSLTDMFNQGGHKLPETWPSKDTYVEKCVGLGFSEAQLKCLDPKWASSDPEGCKTTMEPVLDKSKELSKWLMDEVKAKAGPTPDKETQEEGAE
jgi:hypothetical protein